MKTETIQMMAGAAMLSAFTYIPLLVKNELSGTDFHITLLVALYSTAGFVSSYFFGRAGDMYGRRLVVRAGLLLATVSFGLLLFSNTIEILFIIRTTNGFCIGIYPGALAAYAYESDLKMGRFASFGAAGWGVGTLIAGYAATFNIYYAFLMSSVFLLIAFLSALTLPAVPKVKVKVPLFPVETLKRNLSVYLAMLIRHSSATAIWVLWPIFLFNLGGDEFMIAIVQAFNAVAQVVFMVGLTDRFESRLLVSVGLVSSAVTFFWFTLAIDIITILPSQILLGFAWACLYVGALKYVTENNEERSTASGLLSSVLSISGVIGPIVAATMVSFGFGIIEIMYYAAIMSLIGFLIFVYNGRSLKSGNQVTAIEVQ
ncbi:MAG: MFS transporter [Candidatus Thorarchaeota archaeon]